MPSAPEAGGIRPPGSQYSGVEGDRAASDADRGLAIASLREAAKAGVFDIDELQTRLDAVVSAGTVGELTTITWDARLPVAAPVQGPPALRSRKGLDRLRRNSGFRIHGTLYTAVNAFLVGTWGLTGHHFFWPFFPIAGWGIAVVIHASAVEHAGQRKEEGGRNSTGDDADRRAHV